LIIAYTPARTTAARAEPVTGADRD
jgi:hypothetical protein